LQKKSQIFSQRGCYSRKTPARLIGVRRKPNPKNTKGKNMRIAKPQKDQVEELLEGDSLDTIYQSAFSSYGAHNSEYSDDNYDGDNNY